MIKYLCIVGDIEAQADQAGLELLRAQSARVVPVEMVEGSPELIQLLLGDALGVSRQDLVLDFIDGAGNGGE